MHKREEKTHTCSIFEDGDPKQTETQVIEESEVVKCNGLVESCMPLGVEGVGVVLCLAIGMHIYRPPTQKYHIKTLIFHLQCFSYLIVSLFKFFSIAFLLIQLKLFFSYSPLPILLLCNTNTIRHDSVSLLYLLILLFTIIYHLYQISLS